MRRSPTARPIPLQPPGQNNVSLRPPKGDLSWERAGETTYLLAPVMRTNSCSCGATLSHGAGVGSSDAMGGINRDAAGSRVGKKWFARVEDLLRWQNVGRGELAVRRRLHVEIKSWGEPESCTARAGSGSRGPTRGRDVGRGSHVIVRGDAAPWRGKVMLSCNHSYCRLCLRRAFCH